MPNAETKSRIFDKIDAAQQLTPAVLEHLLAGLVLRNENRSSAKLSDLRSEIDSIDELVMSLLARRMGISREIGCYKKQYGMSVLQPERCDEILEKRARIAETLDLDPDFVQQILKAIHEESVRCQMTIMNG